MTRRRSIVKRSDRAKRMSSLWDSKEIYRDGLTYREWMSRRAKAQRERELAAARAIPTTDPLTEAAAPPAAKAEEQPAPAEPPDRTEKVPAAATTEQEGAGREPAVDAEPAPSSAAEAHPKGRRSRWRRTRR
jgi:hypothetical protein